MRMLIQGFSDTLPELWNNWEIRVLVLVSLSLQLCLLHFGSLRRYSVKTSLSVSLWLAFLGADSVATIALGVISNKLGRSCDCSDSQVRNELMAFWAPFLLLHLGGQDTITAYSVQDTELWLRHLLGLVVQTGVALYIFLLSWKVSWLSFLTIPMFLAGFIKYAERTWVLRSANYSIPVRDISLSGSQDMLDGRYPFMHSRDEFPFVSRDESNTGAEIRDAFLLFEMIKCLFLNQKVYFRHFGYVADVPDPQAVWKTIEDELGYAYDVFYTKAPLFFTAWGFLFRLFSFTSIVFVFVLFLIKERHKHPEIDLIITYLLLVGAVLMEIYAIILLSASNWPWPHDKHRWLTVFDPIRNCFAKLTSKQRWSNSMGQLNLLDLCLKDKSLQDGHGTPNLFANLREWVFNQVLPKLSEELEMLLYRTHKPVSNELKSLVFNTFWEKLCYNRNGFSEDYNKYFKNENALLAYQSIIIWHIATDLCFYTDSGLNERSNKRREVSKEISDYMMYILAMCPLAFSTGDAKPGFEFTRLWLKQFLQERNLSRLPKVEVCKDMISARCSGRQRYWARDSLVPSAIQLAIVLNQFNGKWEIFSMFWVENLANVATLCQGNYHAQLLRKGGEFLTHVWLLIEQFNLSERFQKSRTRP